MTTRNLGCRSSVDIPPSQPTNVQYPSVGRAAVLSETSSNAPETATVVPYSTLFSVGDRKDDINDVIVVVVSGLSTTKLDASNPPSPTNPEPTQPIRPLRDCTPSVTTVLKEVRASHYIKQLFKFSEHYCKKQSKTPSLTKTSVFKLIRSFIVLKFFYRPTGIVGRVAVENSPIDWRLEVL